MEGRSVPVVHISRRKPRCSGKSALRISVSVRSTQRQGSISFTSKTILPVLQCFQRSASPGDAMDYISVSMNNLKPHGDGLLEPSGDEVITEVDFFPFVMRLALGSDQDTRQSVLPYTISPTELYFPVHDVTNTATTFLNGTTDERRPSSFVRSYCRVAMPLEVKIDRVDN